MYQKEFAERLVAREGKNYSRLSVMAYSKADIEILEIVPKKAFRPVPKVDSCIVKVVPIGKRFDLDYEIFDRVVKFLFAHRRKKIKNSIAVLGPLAREAAEKTGVADRRVEEISPEKIAELCKYLEDKNEMEKNI
jgi:16S rRNA (adenine1518-N6/adenine1519-N6)-dimethyltransferase